VPISGIKSSRFDLAFAYKLKVCFRLFPFSNEGEGHSLAWSIYLIIFYLQIGLLDFLSVVFGGLIYFRIDSRAVQLVS
jgi:hypothetical protein